MGKGKGKNKPDKAPKRGANQPPNRLPKQPRPSSHPHAAFAVVELLEAILLLVDHQTLLVSAQRVSTHWHTVIRTSLALQRRLFLAAELETDQTQAAPHPIQQNPLLVRAFPCLFSIEPNPGPHDDSHSRDSAPPWQVQQGLLPRGQNFCTARARDPAPPYEYWVARFAREWRLALLRRGASWRRMFVSKPGVALVGRMGPAMRERPLPESDPDGS
jgi:hypothetical protein